MDVLSPSWFEEVLEMEDPNPFLMDQCDIMDLFDDDIRATIGDDFQICLSPENSNSSSSTLIPRSSSTTTLCVSPPPPLPPQNIITERPKKQRKNNKFNHFEHHQPSSTPIILNFGKKTSHLERAQPCPAVRGTNNAGDEAVLDALVSQSVLGNRDEVPKAGTGTKKANSRIRPPSQTYDHIIAERKRREQLSQRFVALSAIVPGLKKMDKTSVLGDAIKYLKQLQEKVKTLEEQTTKQTMESVVLVRKSQLLIEDEGSSDENNNDGNNNRSSPNDHLPEIEARFSDKNVLIRIHCEKRKGIIVKILSEIEKMDLTIANTSTFPFGTLALDVTIIAEMDKESNTTLKDIVRNLRSAVCGHART